MEIRWIDILAIAQKHRPYEPVRNLRNEIETVLYNRNCALCYKEKKCHDDCIHCDDFEETLERVVGI